MEVRQLKWDFSDVLKGPKTGSFDKYLFNALSMIFPEGERFFVRSVKKFADRAETDAEKAEIKAFIGKRYSMAKRTNSSTIRSWRSISTPNHF